MNPETDLEPGQYSVFEEMEQRRPLIYASVMQRLANFFIDVLLIFAGHVMVLVILKNIEILTDIHTFSWLYDREVHPLLLLIYAMFVSMVMYAIMEGSSKGKSLGKWITGTKVVAEDGTMVGWKQAWFRAFVRVLPFEFLSGVDKYPLHDKWTKTRVIKMKGVI